MNLPHIEPTGVWAMPFGPLWRASHRALLRGLGLTAPVAIALLSALYFAAEYLR
jgi:hypothetical protein